MSKGGYVYILSSKGKRLYTGLTSELQIRIGQHKKKENPDSFTARYNIDQLVYYEAYDLISQAIARESAIKNLPRIEKIKLIVDLNPTWRDLSEDWGKPTTPFDPSKMRPPIGF
jgi:putative endonuclease